MSSQIFFACESPRVSLRYRTIKTFRSPISSAFACPPARAMKDTMRAFCLVTCIFYLGCGEANGSEVAVRAGAQLCADDLKGTYAFTFERIAGNCRELPALVGPYQFLPATCSLNHPDQWSSSQLTRSYSCLDPGAPPSAQVTEYTETRECLQGTVSALAYSGACTAEYTVRLVHQ